jgi:hypothetical protein
MMAARKRWRGKTSERGYGWPHVKVREQRLAVYRPGDICAHGGEALAYWPLSVARLYLDLPHTTDRTGYLPGLSCRRHNRGEGATRGNRQRGQGGGWWQARRW